LTQKPRQYVLFLGLSLEFKVGLPQPRKPSFFDEQYSAFSFRVSPRLCNSAKKSIPDRRFTVSSSRFPGPASFVDKHVTRPFPSSFPPDSASQRKKGIPDRRVEPSPLIKVHTPPPCVTYGPGWTFIRGGVYFFFLPFPWARV